MQNFSNFPLPSYSLSDLLKDIKEGNKNSFTYKGVLFYVSFDNTTLKWVISHSETGNKAFYRGYLNAMLDLQGMAACLIEYKKDLNFDKEGNIIQ